MSVYNWLCPQINLENLREPLLLLSFLRSRCAYPPEHHRQHDIDQSHIGRAFRPLPSHFIQGHVMRLDNRDGSSYGQVLPWGPGAFRLTGDGDAFMPMEAFFLLQSQDFIYSFSRNITKLIMMGHRILQLPKSPSAGQTAAEAKAAEMQLDKLRAQYDSSNILNVSRLAFTNFPVSPTWRLCVHSPITKH